MQVRVVFRLKSTAFLWGLNGYVLAVYKRPVLTVFVGTAVLGRLYKNYMCS